MCQQWKTGPYNETKCAECPFTVIPVKELPGQSKNSKKYSKFYFSFECYWYRDLEWMSICWSSRWLYILLLILLRWCRQSDCLGKGREGLSRLVKIIINIKKIFIFSSTPCSCHCLDCHCWYRTFGSSFVVSLEVAHCHLWPTWICRFHKGPVECPMGCSKNFHQTFLL